MSNNDYISDGDAKTCNLVGVIIAATGIAASFIIAASIGFRFVNSRELVQRHFRALPTRMLYTAIFTSLIFSIFWIISCSSLAHNSAACNMSMFFIVCSVHIMNGLCLAILLHCGLLLSAKNARIASALVRFSLAFIVLASVALGSAGLAASRYGYLQDQNTCWIISADGKPPGSMSAYEIELALLYGPIFLCLLLEWAAVGYVVYALHAFKKHTGIGAKTRSLIRRLVFPPAFLSIHCLMVIGGDLPITYHSRAGQYTSFIMNYIGFSSFAVALCGCAIWADPAFMSIMRPSRQDRPERSDSDIEHRIKHMIGARNQDNITTTLTNSTTSSSSSSIEPVPMTPIPNDRLYSHHHHIKNNDNHDDTITTQDLENKQGEKVNSPAGQIQVQEFWLNSSTFKVDSIKPDKHDPGHDDEERFI